MYTTGKLRKRQQTKKHKGKNKQNSTQANISLFRKVRVPQWPAPVKLIVLLGSPSCRPLPLPLLRKSREHLASGGLLFSSVVAVVHSDFWLNFIAVYPVVWLSQNALLLGACAIWTQKTIYTGFKRENLFLLRILNPYRSLATVAAFRVPLTPYRPRRVAAMDCTVTMGCSPRLDVPLSHHRAALRWQVLDAV